MKRYIIVPFIVALAFIFCFGGVVNAQENDGLPDPGITPDSTFYFVDKWGKQISLMFTFKAENKVNKALRYADERLAELEAMLAKNKVREATKASYEYQNCLTVATKYTEKAKAKGIDTSESAALATFRHLVFLNNSIVNAPENARMIITQTRERTRVCQETLLRSMAQGDPEKAMRTNLMLMEQQLNRIRVRVEEQETKRFEEQVQEYERLNNLGQEISQIAKSLGKETAIDQLVGQATAYHLEILAQVRERVQEETRATVDEVMQVCIKNHERVVTTLKAKNQLGEIPEKPPIPEEIPEIVRQRISSGESQGKR